MRANIMLLSGIAILIVAATAFLLVGFLVVRPVLANRRRRRFRESIEQEPFPSEWHAMLLRKFKLYGKLPPSVRQELQLHTRILIAEKSFESPADLGSISDEMRVLIMAQAALLTAGRRPCELYPDLFSIILYPTAYLDSGERTFSLHEDPEHRLGESWTTGSVVLAWDSVQLGAANKDDGRNVVLHEFAHQLDQADGRGDGVPILADPSEYGDWAQVFSHHYAELVEDTEHGRKTLLDPYGAEDPAEFFAVATEAFFERSTKMRQRLPDLYEELADYFGLDPASWK